MFNKEIALITEMNCNKSLYTFFPYFRVEFQQRGAPHVHMIMWLKDKDGNRPEDVFDKEALAVWLDTIISGNIPEETDEYREKFLPNIDPSYEKDLIEKASKFQNHGHTFR